MAFPESGPPHGEKIGPCFFCLAPLPLLPLSPPSYAERLQAAVPHTHPAPGTRGQCWLQPGLAPGCHGGEVWECGDTTPSCAPLSPGLVPLVGLPERCCRQSTDPTNSPTAPHCPSKRCPGLGVQVRNVFPCTGRVFPCYSVCVSMYNVCFPCYTVCFHGTKVHISMLHYGKEKFFIILH